MLFSSYEGEGADPIAPSMPRAEDMLSDLEGFQYPTGKALSNLLRPHSWSCPEEEEMTLVPPQWNKSVISHKDNNQTQNWTAEQTITPFYPHTLLWEILSHQAVGSPRRAC